MSVSVEEAKKLAAFAAVDKEITSGMAIGIGSGSTIVYAVERIAHRVKNGELNLRFCVPSSWQATQLIRQYNLPLQEEVALPFEFSEGSHSVDFESNSPLLDITIDGADEVDPNGNLIKGGGGCQTREKMVASFSKKLVIVADARKDSEILGKQFPNVPIEVIPGAWSSIARILIAGSTRDADRGWGAIKAIKLRGGSPSKAGPCITDNGGLILDVNFGEITPERASRIERLISRIPGVVCIGLFVDLPVSVYFCDQEGKITNRKNHLWEEGTCWASFC